MHPLTDDEKKAVRRYLKADSRRGDPTADLFDGAEGLAVILPEENCILSGIEVMVYLFSELSCSLEFRKGAVSGAEWSEGEPIAHVHGAVPDLLRGERVALNIISRMSGVATAAGRASKIAEEASPGTRVAGTRKTTPGFNLFEKRALIDGGALPHRYDLSSMAMIKDNHLSSLGNGPNAVKEAVRRIREIYGPYLKIEVEIEDIDCAIAAVDAGAEIIMIDNRSPEECAFFSEALRKRASDLGREVTLEASGGITLETIPEYAPHVDVISMGSLTEGYRPIGFKMEMDLD
ncbi:MAG: carboxylating nicotinate-nucleotide diphosphorylase [Thermoplasmatota archaeon]